MSSLIHFLTFVCVCVCVFFFLVGVNGGNHLKPVMWMFFYLSKTNFFWTFDLLSFIIVSSFILVLVFFFSCWVWLLRKRRIVNDTWISSPIGFPIFWGLSKIKYILPLVWGLRFESFDPVWVALVFLFFGQFWVAIAVEINKILAPFSQQQDKRYMFD